ncbi:MAG TPA: AAA family ATPase [Stellaceae bacterium]|nr:AAA family ATPase [Stellaceae bacterium]
MGVVIFLNGPIGVGKTTLGQGLAERLDAAFIDSDDLRNHSKTWVEEVLSGSKALVRVSMAALSHRPILVVAKPLRHRDWAFLRAKFQAEGVAALCVTLTAPRDTILDARRGRDFTPGERARIVEMIAQGYGERPFSDLVLATDRAGFAETVTVLVDGCHVLLGKLGPT